MNRYHEETNSADLEYRSAIRVLSGEEGLILWIWGPLRQERAYPKSLVTFKVLSSEKQET